MVDILASGAVAVILDILQVLSGVCDAFEVGVALKLNEFKISLDAFFHTVIGAEVAPDRGKRSCGVLLLGGEIYTLSGPAGSALESEVVVVFSGERRFSPAALVDRLGDDGAVDLRICAHNSRSGSRTASWIRWFR